MDFEKVFKNQIKNGKLSHAYLIVGQFDFEKIIQILSISRADISIIDEVPIKISHIRGLIHSLSLTPHSSKYKLAIVLNMESATIESSNAILKFLEEPTNSSIIILQARKIDRILPTVISRCQIIRLNSERIEEKNDFKINKIIKMSIRERLELADQIVNVTDKESIINSWEEYYRQELKAGKDVLNILRRISSARSLLFTNVSVKLLIENLFLEFK